MRLVICAPSHGALNTELRELGIPPHALLRRDVTVVTDAPSLRNVRGLPGFAWCTVPGYVLTPTTHSSLVAQSRVPGGGELPWLEALVRILAWRQYHEQ